MKEPLVDKIVLPKRVIDQGGTSGIWDLAKVLTAPPTDSRALLVQRALQIEEAP